VNNQMCVCVCVVMFSGTVVHGRGFN